MEINHHILWLWLKELLGFNNKKLLRLVSFFGSVEEIYQAEDFSKCTFLTAAERAALTRKNLRSAWEVYGDCAENQIGILTLDDPLYPGLLREIANPPSPLFFKGHLQSCLAGPLLTVVGTRSCNGYGEFMTREIVAALCCCGFGIVCGTARGIDSVVLKPRHEVRCDAIDPLLALFVGIRHPMALLHVKRSAFHIGRQIRKHIPRFPACQPLHFAERKQAKIALLSGDIRAELHAGIGVIP